MVQKNLFKGKAKDKKAAANRHGKLVTQRKGRIFKAPKKKTDDYLASNEVTKYIDKANEVKVATKALKEGGQLKFVKGNSTASEPKKKKKADVKGPEK
ncbi:hypothetical protein KFL_002110200 [Klebsormidium nitens]|uniref:Uncharacterized protein n=1 Tax=Klebsormidium nitens TaxID=105231 RepID=A0A1Y1I4L7_KLENI|nr:hypothetical protein KFL_002110200 [Klebsormidium nitens]|eukprot:GAQ84902.1 hypothetical protein KFL_002110200 [Klebsormidium nitens]